MKVSIIIRTLNEEKTIRFLLERLKYQTFQDFEIILVDNTSQDKTLEIAREYNISNFIHIPKGNFSHPKSENEGIKKAKGELIVLTNGHCVPFDNLWLENGLKNFLDPQVAGIDGHYVIGGWGTSWQKKQDILYEKKLWLRKEGEWISTTNAIIRKSLWETYPFDETLPECEDYDWSKEMISRGYKIIKDPLFNVYHIHPLTKSKFAKRKENWTRIVKEIDKKKKLSL